LPTGWLRSVLQGALRIVAGSVMIPQAIRGY
jgi:hypothetical protein